MPLYFAYGSNLLAVRLRGAGRAPRATPVAAGRLCGFRLAFHKRGRDGSGKCDVTVTDEASDVVWGALWEVSSEELATLDAAEGTGYRREPVRVDAVGGGTIRAQTYLARPDWVDPSLRPFDWYLGLVLAGARERGLPEEWLRRLEGVTARSDADGRRRARFMALLPGDDGAV